MLFFEGSIFYQSPAMYEHYQEFLLFKDYGEVFMSIDGITDIDYSLYKNQTAIQIENVKYASDLCNNRYLISYGNYDIITENHFSKLCLNSLTVQNDCSLTAYDRLNECVHQIAKFRALYLDMLLLHASAVVYRAEVLLFSGVSGAGKSTQARLWMENTDAWVLNYDKPILKLDSERVMVSGSPWGGKEDLAINEIRPAKALFFVHQAKENRVVRLSAAQAYAQAHLNYFVYPLSEDVENRYSDAIIRLIKKIPIYDLYCTDTADAVEAVRQVLYPEEE